MNAHIVTDDYATFEGSSTLIIQRLLPGPVDRLWNYLTDSELRRKWLAAGDMPLAAGATMELVWRNDELSDASDARPEGFAEEQRMGSHVISVDPMRQITFAWGAGDVSFSLDPKGDKVLLTITHRGIEERGARVMIGAGWHMHLDILASILRGVKSASFWSGWAKLQTEYRARIS